MSDDVCDRTSAGVEVDRLVLDAKLSVPQSRPGSVSRAGLIEAARASNCRVVGVTAPAGYGKSTLLSQWALAEDRRVAWVSLDRFDDDPAVLLTILACAYARVSPGNDDLVADMGGVGVSALGRAAPHLAAVLATSQAPFVLLVDDLHELRSPVCHDVLEVVISGIPRGSQLAAASRSEQPHLPRLDPGHRAGDRAQSGHRCHACRARVRPTAAGHHRQGDLVSVGAAFDPERVTQDHRFTASGTRSVTATSRESPSVWPGFGPPTFRCRPRTPATAAHLGPQITTRRDRSDRARVDGVCWSSGLMRPPRRVGLRG